MIIGLSGLSRSGKDVVADRICEKHKFVKVALADPIKRIAQEVFRFTDDQLWGDKPLYDVPDERYPRALHLYPPSKPGDEIKCQCCGKLFHEKLGHDPCFLTPRYSVKMLGTECARHCYLDTWVDYAMRVASELLDKDYSDTLMYNGKEGLIERIEQTPQGEFRRDDAPDEIKGVVIPDCRYRNEMAAVKKQGKLIRVQRPGHEKPMSDHSSETEQMEMPEQYFDYILRNDGDLHHAGLLTDSMMDVLQGRIREYDAAQADVPPFLRK